MFLLRKPFVSRGLMLSIPWRGDGRQPACFGACVWFSCWNFSFRVRFRDLVRGLCRVLFLLIGLGRALVFRRRVLICYRIPCQVDSSGFAGG